MAPATARADVYVQVGEATYAEEARDEHQVPVAPADDEESSDGDGERDCPEPEQDDSSKDGKERLRHDGGARADFRSRATLATWHRDFDGALRADRGHQGLPEKPPRT